MQKNQRRRFARLREKIQKSLQESEDDMPNTNPVGIRLTILMARLELRNWDEEWV